MYCLETSCTLPSIKIKEMVKYLILAKNYNKCLYTVVIFNINISKLFNRFVRANKIRLRKPD